MGQHTADGILEDSNIHTVKAGVLMLSESPGDGTYGFEWRHKA